MCPSTVAGRLCHSGDADALQSDINALQQWTDTWLMQFNASKCQVLRVTLKRKPVQTSHTISGQTLEEVDIDSKLTFNNHIDSICKRANSSRAFLSRNLRSCTKDTRDKTYKTYIRPTVEYASTVWDPHTSRSTKKLEQVQRHSARYVTGNRDYNCSTTKMVQDLGWPTLDGLLCCAAYSNSFFPHTTRDWNVLPADPATFHSADAFKNHLSTAVMPHRRF